MEKKLRQKGMILPLERNHIWGTNKDHLKKQNKKRLNKTKKVVVDQHAFQSDRTSKSVGRTKILLIDAKKKSQYEKYEHFFACLQKCLPQTTVILRKKSDKFIEKNNKPKFFSLKNKSYAKIF